jgi:putative dehydrogenase
LRKQELSGADGFITLLNARRRALEFFMKKIGLIGLGDMGIGMAKNLVASGFELHGYDLREERLQALKALGGVPASSIEQVASGADAVFVMVLNGGQVQSIVLNEGGLLESMTPGSTIIVSATIKPSEVEVIVAPCADKGVHIIDTPVSGGKAGADGGTLTMMAATNRAVFDKNLQVLQAVGQNIFHVGEEVGQGQKIKAVLQAIIGASFAVYFEALVLGSKAGIKGETMFDVISSSGVGSPLFKNCAKLIMERKFKDTGSHIGTMYKDLGITMDFAKEQGAAMFTTSAAHELFQSGISMFPEEDNWAIVKLLEQIAGTEVNW